MSSPRLSVTMPVYNNRPYVAQSIESILNQTFDDFEFIIINDGSTDGSAEIINDYAAKDTRIRVVHQHNQGIVASANHALSLAKGELLARMDGDDIARPDRLQKQVAYLDAHPDIGAVGSWISIIDQNGAERAGGADIATDPKDLHANLAHGTPIFNPTAVMRLALAKRIGGYRSAYHYCEDYEFWLRLAEHTQFANIPERLLQYRNYAGQVSSKHAIRQRFGTYVAYAAYQARLSGKPDPVAHLDHMPDADTLGRLFQNDGFASALRTQALSNQDWNLPAFANGGTDVLIEAIRAGDPAAETKRALKIAGRLAKARQFRHAWRIVGATLAQGRARNGATRHR